MIQLDCRLSSVDYTGSTFPAPRRSICEPILSVTTPPGRYAARYVRSAATWMMAAMRVPIVERTPMAKYSVRPSEPKYAIEKGRRSFEMMCCRSGWLALDFLRRRTGHGAVEDGEAQHKQT